MKKRSNVVIRQRLLPVELRFEVSQNPVFDRDRLSSLHEEGEVDVVDLVDVLLLVRAQRGWGWWCWPHHRRCCVSGWGRGVHGVGEHLLVGSVLESTAPYHLQERLVIHLSYFFVVLLGVFFLFLRHVLF
jgi:hypothetical protein